MSKIKNAPAATEALVLQQEQETTTASEILQSTCGENQKAVSESDSQGLYAPPSSISNDAMPYVAALNADITETGCEGPNLQAVEEQSELEFPIEAFPQEFKQLGQQYAELAQIPIQLPMMLMLAVASGACGKNVQAEGGSDRGTCRGNLFIMACAKSSTGKDITARLAEPLFDFEIGLQDEFNELHLPARLVQREDAERTIKDRKASTEDREDAYRTLETISDASPFLTISNTTSEALGDRLEQNDGTLLSFSAEAGDLLRTIAGQYRKTGGDYALYNAAWSGTRTEYTRVSRGTVIIQDPCLSLFWAVQPNYFAELADSEEALHSGFLPRVLAFDAEAEYALDDGVIRTADSALMDKWTGLVQEILDRRCYGKESAVQNITCTPEAREIFRQFHNKKQDQRNRESDIATLLGKARENAIRVALVLAVMETTDKIDAATAEGACRIVDWCLASTVQLLQGARSEALERAANKLEEKLCNSDYNGTATLRQLRSRHGFETEKVEQLVRHFPNRFEIITIQSPAGGRPSPQVKLVH